MSKHREPAKERKILKPLNVVVSTFDIASDDEESNRVVNILDPEKRKWIFKHFIYAVNNGKSVEIAPLTD